MEQQQFLDFALEIAKAAEAQIMPYYRNHTVSIKPDGTEVTLADHQAETVMREMIEQQFPNHDILGEEFGSRNLSKATYQWILDPLDGTTPFTLGVPIFGTLVALLEEEEPIVGVVHLPAIGETVYAAKGLGCWFQHEASEPIRVQVKPSVPVKEAMLSFAGVHSSTIFAQPGQVAYNLPALINQTGKFRFFGYCSQHALVCRGNIHAAIDTIMNPWDVAALIPCIKEAGGMATTLLGQSENIVFGGSLLTSCGGQLHTEILSLLQPY